jgi:hypothetical protein
LAEFHPVVREHLDIISEKYGICCTFLKPYKMNSLSYWEQESQIIISAILKAK